MIRPGLIVSLACLATLGLARGQEPRVHLPEADEVAAVLRDADGARGRGELARAVELYRIVLEGERGGYQLLRAEATGTQRRWVGVTSRAMAGLRALPPEGVRLFRAGYDPRALAAMREARQAREPFVALARIYDRYPISTHAPAILETMAGIALERGQLERARGALRQLLTHHAGEVADPTRVRRQLLLVAVASGRPEEVRAVARELLRDDPRARMWPGNRPIDEQELVTRAMQARSSRGRPSLRLGRVDPENRASVEVKPAIGAARFPPRTFDPGRAGPPRALPLLHEDRVIVVLPDQVLAWDVRTGQAAPRVPKLGPQFTDPNPKVQTGGAIDGGMLVAPFVEEVRSSEEFRGVPIKVQLPRRKLAGFDLTAWRWSWNHARVLAGTRLEGHSFPCPPTVVEGVVYAPAFDLEGFVNASVAAFDAVTGAPLWDTWVVSGQVEQTMFGEQAIEPLCTPVAVSDGVVYHVTSLGCIAALDAVTGRPLWIGAHQQIDVRAPAGFFPDPRVLPWENNAPIVVAGVVIAAPLDANVLVGFDARTGERRWDPIRQQPGRELRWLLGACTRGEQSVVIVGGGNEVRGLDPRTGRLSWRATPEGRIAGRGCVAQNHVVVPLDSNRVVFLDAFTGTRVGAAAPVGTGGNVVLVGDHALITGPSTLAVHKAGGDVP